MVSLDIIAAQSPATIEGEDYQLGSDSPYLGISKAESPSALQQDRKSVV